MYTKIIHQLMTLITWQEPQIKVTLINPCMENNMQLEHQETLNSLKVKVIFEPKSKRNQIICSTFDFNIVYIGMTLRI